MSQPTRARMTGAATRKPRKTATAPETFQTDAALPVAATDAIPPQPAAPDGDPAPAFAPEALARTLRAVAAELERDPALARRVAAAVAIPSESAHTQAAHTASLHAAGARTTESEHTEPGARAVESEDTEAKRARSEAAGCGGTGSGDAPALRRINRGFRPKLVTGASPDLGVGIPDPFALYARRGEDGLRAALDDLRLGSLRAIIREHGLDAKGTLVQQNDAEKLRAAILRAAKKGRK